MVQLLDENQGPSQLHDHIPSLVCKVALSVVIVIVVAMAVVPFCFCSIQIENTNQLQEEQTF